MRCAACGCLAGCRGRACLWVGLAWMLMAGLVQPLVVRVSSSVDGVSVWTVRAVAVGDDGAERDGSVVECEGLGVCGGVVRVGGLDFGQRYVVRGRVWGGGRESVSLWSCGVSVMTSSVMRLPPAMRLPAMDLGVDLAALSWGEPVTIDWVGRPRLPSVAALDDDRLVVAWMRCESKTNHIRAVRRLGRSRGPVVDTGFRNEPYWIQERRVAPLGADRCVLLERQRDQRVVCRRACVAGLAVTLDDATELGGPCGQASDVYRLDNGLYVVSGHGAGVGGEAGRAGVCAVRVGLDGRVEVLGRRAVGAATGISVADGEPVAEPCLRGTCRRRECRPCRPRWEDGVLWRACCGWLRHG